MEKEKASAGAVFQGNQFGTFQGVFIPSTLTILGVILFLRLGWVVGQAGLTTAIIIIVFSSTITFITGLSISSTATNTKVGAGGSYFLISRCFGTEPGAAIGLPLYLAQALGISFYLVGFAESLKLFFPSIPVMQMALLSLIVLAVVTFISSDLALKVQVFVFVIILAAISMFLLSPPGSVNTPVGPEQEFVQFGFWQIFAVFFPAVTGIEAGISMSGDLKNPNKSLPWGTIAAILVGLMVYIGCAVKFSSVADPNVLVNHSMLMADVAFWPIIIFVGLWGATLSSSLGAMMGAPRTLQALAKDSVVPKILASGSGPANEPKYAMAFSYIVAAAGILLGDLNSIAALLSMFFLTSYGVLNLVSGLESLISNPSWRPTFKTPWYISITGAGLCFGAMLLINSGLSILAALVIAGVYLVMRKRNLQPKYSDIRSGLITHFARNLIYALSEMKVDARNWRPHFLVLSGAPKSRFYLIDFVYSMTQRRGFMTVAAVLTGQTIDFKKLGDFEDSADDFLEKRKIHSLFKVIKAESLADGARSLIRSYGIGKVVPNTVVLGARDSQGRGEEAAKIIYDAYRNGKNTMIFKKPSDVDPQEKLQDLSRIDIWWRGKKSNASLMLALIYLYMTSGQARKTKLHLNSIVKHEEERQGIIAAYTHFMKLSRVPAKIDVYVDDDTKSSIECIRRYSQGSKMILMGLRPPDQEESIEEFSNYYQEVLDQTQEFPLTAFVLVGQEKIEFQEIFS